MLSGLLVYARQVKHQPPVIAVKLCHIAGCVLRQPLLGAFFPSPGQRHFYGLDIDGKQHIAELIASLTIRNYEIIAQYRIIRHIQNNGVLT